MEIPAKTKHGTKPKFRMKRNFRRRLISLIGMVSIAVALGACVPSANYEEPLSEIGRSVSPASVGQSDSLSQSEPRVDQFKSLILGVIVTDNSKKAMGVMSGTQKGFTGLTREDLDATFLTKRIDDSLKRRFKDVIALPNFDAKRSENVDAVMYLDIIIKLGIFPGSSTTVDVQGIFVDDNQTNIGQVKGDGAATVPFPVTILNFKAAATQAVEEFSRSLDGATELASKLEASPSLSPAPSTIAEAIPPSSAVSPPKSTAVQERRIALVVGNSNYKYIPSLGNPSNDARLMARTLRDLGFSLVGGKAQIDLDKPGFDRAVRSFGDEMRGSTIALFYYAGHGVQVRGTNYLIPVSANPTKESDVDFELVDAQLVLHQMDDGGARLNVLILDACRNNPFGGRGLRSSSGGLAQMQAPKGTLISYSTQPGNVAADGRGRDSPYTEAVAQAIQKPGADILHVFNNVGVMVEQKTGGAQQPWISSSPIEGEFYFAGSSNPP